MKLYLMQHGDALPSEADPERSLSQRGRQDVENMATFLVKIPLQPSRVLHSGKLRAQQTAELIVAGACPNTAIEAISGLKPQDPVDPMEEQVQGWRADVLIVGHMPFVGRLTSRLVGNDPDLGVVAFRPGAIVCLERTQDGSWQIAWMIRPELLR